MLKTYAFVHIATHLSLEEVGRVVSSSLFRDAPFDFEASLRDEVPGLAIEGNVFRLTTLINGGGSGAADGYPGKQLYRLEFFPEKLQRQQRFTHWLGVGEWIAQILSQAPEFEIVDWLPSSDNVVGEYSKSGE